MKVFVADDDATMRKMIARYLQMWGYTAVAFVDGQTAYAGVMEEKAPCMAILDWLMPGMDGVDICRQLRERGDKGPFVYRILITGKTDASDRLLGLEAGAHDFLHKPFDPEELRLRLDVGARIIAYERTLAQQNAKLTAYAQDMESLAQDRARQLLQADRMATLGLMLAGVAHEMGNALMSITATSGELQEQWPEIEVALAHYLEHAPAGTDTQNLQTLLEEMPEILTELEQGTHRVGAIVRTLNSYSRQDDASTKPTSLERVVREALRVCRPRLGKHTGVEVHCDPALPAVPVNEQRLLQAVVNIIINAADAMEAVENACLRIVIERDEDAARIMVEDNGHGLPHGGEKKIWDPFYTTKDKDKGTGLGLSICRTIIEEHGGAMYAENRAEGGARFILRLPLTKPHHEQASPGAGQ